MKLRPVGRSAGRCRNHTEATSRTCPSRVGGPHESRVACSMVSRARRSRNLVVPGSVSAAELHVMISAGFYRVYAELGPAFKRATGHRLVTTRGPSIGDSPEAIPTASREASSPTS